MVMNNHLTQGVIKGVGLTAARVFILLVFLFCTESASAVTQRVWGYVAWWMQDEWKTLNLSNFERLIFIEMKVSAEGGLTERRGWPEQWTTLQKATSEGGVPLDIALTLFENEVFNKVFTSPSDSRRLLEDALTVAKHKNVSGLHLDFEVTNEVSRDAIAGFRQFLSVLSRQMKLQFPLKKLSVFLPFGNYLRIYDVASLAQVDHFVLQGYDAHYLDSPVAGPVSPLSGMDIVNWEKMLAAADNLGVSRARMVMGFPLYGYEWVVPSCLPRGEHVGKGATTTLLPVSPTLNLGTVSSVQERVALYGARVEPVSKSLYYRFVGPSGVCTVGWFEDSWSLQMKSDWLIAQNLGGIAFFPLGYDKGVLVEPLLAKWKRKPSLGDPSSR